MAGPVFSASFSAYTSPFLCPIATQDALVAVRTAAFCRDGIEKKETGIRPEAARHPVQFISSLLHRPPCKPFLVLLGVVLRRKSEHSFCRIDP